MKNKIIMPIVMLTPIISIYLIGSMNYDNYYTSVMHNTSNGDCCECEDCPSCDVCCRCRDINPITKAYKGFLYYFK